MGRVGVAPAAVVVDGVVGMALKGAGVVNAGGRRRKR